jgi:hypothetical protein
MLKLNAARVAPIVLLLILSSGCAGDAQGSSQSGSSKSDWSFLANSYWIVPPPNLPALLSNTDNGGTFIPISDQTVFYIQTYQDGYFWGKTATLLTVAGQPSGPNCFQMVGSVTPEGAVLLSFTPTGSSGVQTTGVGTMRFIKGQWTMENQMSTGSSSGQVTHWAYMAQCATGQPCMQNLPGTDLSVQQMLAPCS